MIRCEHRATLRQVLRCAEVLLHAKVLRYAKCSVTRAATRSPVGTKAPAGAADLHSVRRQPFFWKMGNGLPLFDGS